MPEFAIGERISWKEGENSCEGVVIDKLRNRHVSKGEVDILVIELNNGRKIIKQASEVQPEEPGKRFA